MCIYYMRVYVCVLTRLLLLPAVSKGDRRSRRRGRGFPLPMLNPFIVIHMTYFNVNSGIFNTPVTHNGTVVVNMPAVRVEFTYVVDDRGEGG